jgi:hypothetical protein
MRALRRLLWAWWTVVRDPRRIRGGEFPFGFMVAVWFYLGFLYNTFHFFLYPGYIKEEFHAGLEFWLHSLYGGASQAASFLMAGVGGYLGFRLLGKRISYRRWEVLLFSLGFIALLPVLLGALFILVGFTGPTGKVVFWSLPLFPKRLASCVVVTLVLGSLLFLRLFRSLGLGLKGLAVMGLAVPGFYLLLEAGFRTVERAAIQLGAVSLEAQYLAGSLWALLEGGVALVLRSRLKGK